jgi:hypothetical protein
VLAICAAQNNMLLALQHGVACNGYCHYRVPTREHNVEALITPDEQHIR